MAKFLLLPRYCSVHPAYKLSCILETPDCLGQGVKSECFQGSSFLHFGTVQLGRDHQEKIGALCLSSQLFPGF